MTTTRIDLKNLTPRMKILLADFLFEQAILGEKICERNKVYSLYRFKDESMQESETVEICLSHDIVIRSRYQYAYDFRFDVVDHESLVGAGACGEVYDIYATLHLKNNTELVVDQSKSRVMKIQTCNSDILDEIRQEHHITRIADNMNIKPLVVVKTDNENYRCYMALRKLSGTDLEHITDQMLDGNLTLLTSRRLKIGLLILQKLIELHEKGIVHRDMKRENVFLELNKSILEIFDYGISKMNDENDEDIFVGSPGFIAPEVYAGRGTNYKSDVFAVGVMIASLFNAHEPEQDEYSSKEYDFENIFNDNKITLTQLEKNNLLEILKKMTHKDVEKRYDAKEAYRALHQFLDDYTRRVYAEFAKKREKQYTFRNGKFFDRPREDIAEQTHERDTAHRL